VNEHRGTNARRLFATRSDIAAARLLVTDAGRTLPTHEKSMRSCERMGSET